jgi:integrase/recombinase XerD
MDALIKQFLRSGQYLRNWSPRTVTTYGQGLTCLQVALREEASQGDNVTAPILTKGNLQAWVVSMRQRGLTPGGCNMYMRSVNSFLTWMHEEGHTATHLRVKLLPNPAKPLQGISDREAKLLLTYRPKGFYQHRAKVLVCLLLDTGLRIDEAITLRSEWVNWDGLVLLVRGKGNKERMVPFSPELRKELFKLDGKAGKRDYLMAPRHNHGKLSYRNAYRHIKLLCAKAGVEGKHIHPHAFRHCFAVNYMRMNKNIYQLSRILGHASITTTTLYLRSLGVEHLSEGHCSVLTRL